MDIYTLDIHPFFIIFYNKENTGILGIHFCSSTSSGSTKYKVRKVQKPKNQNLIDFKLFYGIRGPKLVKLVHKIYLSNAGCI